MSSFIHNRYSQAKVKALKAVVFLLLPSLCCASGPYSGNANRSALVDQLKANPILIQQAREYVLSEYPTITQIPEQLAFFSSTGGVAHSTSVGESGGNGGFKFNGKAPRAIGRARGTMSRNLRPITITSQQIAQENSDEENNDNISITPGREFAHHPEWNSWIDAYYFDVKDRRYNIEFNAKDYLVVIGTDKLITNNVAIGLLMSFQNAETDNFGGNWLSNANELTIGPYLGYQISPRWALNTSLGYSHTDNNVHIANLRDNYVAQTGSIEIDLGGQYNFKRTHVRIKPSVFYSYTHTNAYQMTGTIAGSNVIILVPEDSYTLGVAVVSFEVFRDYKVRPLKVLEPFADVGVVYAFQRPNNGLILTGNLTLASTSAWSGTARVGVRSQINSSIYVSANVGYLSIGQGNLNIWEGHLYMSYSF